MIEKANQPVPEAENKLKSGKGGRLKRNDQKLEPPKLHSSEEEYYSKSDNTGDSDKQEDDSDLYDKIKLAEG